MKTRLYEEIIKIPYEFYFFYYFVKLCFKYKNRNIIFWNMNLMHI